MNSKDFRNLARENLKGRWGSVALLTFLYLIFVDLITFFASFLGPFGSIATIVINPVISFGFLYEMMLFRSGAQVEVLDFFKLGFTSFSKVWKLIFALIPKFVGPMILMGVSLIGITVGAVFLIVSQGAATVTAIACIIIASLLMVGAIIWIIPISYRYAFAFNELIYQPELHEKEIVKQAASYMMGKRWKVFKLQFSFIGWSLLAVLGLGIPYIWISPYIAIAQVFFYEWASGRLQNKTGCVTANYGGQTNQADNAPIQWNNGSSSNQNTQYERFDENLK